MGANENDRGVAENENDRGVDANENEIGIRQNENGIGETENVQDVIEDIIEGVNVFDDIDIDDIDENDRGVDANENDRGIRQNENGMGETRNVQDVIEDIEGLNVFEDIYVDDVDGIECIGVEGIDLSCVPECHGDEGKVDIGDYNWGEKGKHKLSGSLRKLMTVRRRMRVKLGRKRMIVVKVKAMWQIV